MFIVDSAVGLDFLLFTFITDSVYLVHTWKASWNTKTLSLWQFRDISPKRMNSIISTAESDAVCVEKHIL